MDDQTVTLHPAGDSLAVVEGLLAEAGLPTGDVRENPGCFYVGYDGEDVVGVGGVEGDGTAALLRSVVVAESERGNGYGTALCDALEDRAREDGVETLYLLTTTAEGFFADRGYAVVERTDAPPEVRATAQFDALCPESATCMRSEL